MMRVGATIRSNTHSAIANFSSISTALAALLIEGTLLVAEGLGMIGLFGALAVHVAVVAVLLARVRVAQQAGEDTSAAILMMMTTAVVGPLGALGSLVVFALAPTTPKPSRLLADWYSHIARSMETSDAMRIADQVSSGRAIDLSARAPGSFVALMEQNGLSEQQNALGLIARRFDLDYLSALQAALKSTEPVIRVQAAAVAASIREQLARNAHQLMAQADESQLSLGGLLHCFSRLERCHSSGLMEESDRVAVRATADKVEQRCLDGFDASIADGSATALSKEPAAVLEGLLIRHGLYGQLRRLRHHRSRVCYGRYRFRRVRWHRALHQVNSGGSGQ
jgi:hypothetical protein